MIELCCKKPVLLDMVLQATFFGFYFLKKSKMQGLLP